MTTPPPAATAMGGLDASSLLRETLRLVRAYPLPLLGLPVLLGVVTGGGNGGGPPPSPSAVLALLPFVALAALVAIVLVALASVAVALVVTRAALDAVATAREPDLGSAWRGVQGGYWGAFGTFVLWFLAIAVGLILLVAPGVFLVVAWFPIAAVVVSEGLHGSSPFGRAWALTLGHKGQLFIVLLAGAAVAIAGAILLRWIPILGGALSGAVSGAVNGALLTAGAVFYARASARPTAPVS